MKIINTAIEGVYIIEPQVFEDNRGYFFESYNKQKMDEAGLKYDFIQDNQSMSKYGTIRGIHFQKGDFAQAKLVRVLEGTVLDVAVDLRKGSKTFGKHVAVELSAENKRILGMFNPLWRTDFTKCFQQAEQNAQTRIVS